MFPDVGPNSRKLPHFLTVFGADSVSVLNSRLLLACIVELRGKKLEVGRGMERRPQVDLASARMASKYCCLPRR
jgi:hypothetical protein